MGAAGIPHGMAEPEVVSGFWDLPGSGALHALVEKSAAQFLAWLGFLSPGWVVFPLCVGLSSLLPLWMWATSQQSPQFFPFLLLPGSASTQGGEAGTGLVAAAGL